MEENKKPSVCFGHGYRIFAPVYSIEIWPFFTLDSNILNDSSTPKVNSMYNTSKLLVNTKHYKL
nr:MAG TPA: hypothetical protein [Microviridae sp.]